MHLPKFPGIFFNNRSKLTILLLVLIVTCNVLVGCKKNKNNVPAPEPGDLTVVIDSTAITEGAPEGSTEKGANVDDLIENSTFNSIVTITMGATATIANPVGSGVVITQSNGDVVVNATASNVEYVITGTTTNGSVKFYSDKKFKITLNNSVITNNDGPAINIQSSKRMFINVPEGSVNTLADGVTYAPSTEDMKGTIFAEGQMIIGGKGTLNIQANNKHAIVSDDYVRITGGIITVSGTVSDGIHANDAIIIDDGNIVITSAKDGIEAEEGHVIINGGKVRLNTADKGIRTSYEGTDAAIVPYININGGSVTVTSSAGEGIESKNNITINNGNIIVNAADDAFNAEKALHINGGYIYAASTANDAMDSNGTVTITGGRVVAVGGTGPEGIIDCDPRQVKITGGSIVGIAGSTSGPTPDVSTIRSVIMGSGDAGIIHIEAVDGTEALTFQAPKAYTTLLFASAKLKPNTTYHVYTGGSVASDVNFKGWYSGGIYTKGTRSATSFTTTGMVTQTGGNLTKN